MRKLRDRELKQILEKHEAWLKDEYGGERANLQYADLQGAYLQEANLRDADLQGAYLREAYLQEADLQGADLRGADLRDAYLQGAYLQEANLQEADLRGADLRGAGLQGAYLQEANLQGAYLQYADLRGADLRENLIQIGPVGSRKDYTIYWVGRDVVQCGCWNGYKGGSLDEFIARVDEKYPPEDKENARYRQEYLAAIEMFKRLKGAGDE